MSEGRTPTAISAGQSQLLDLCRWIAALLVVCEHARSLMFEDYGAAVKNSIMQRPFYLITGFGHEAVIVFFVISGFLVGGKAWERWKDGRFEWLTYLIDRISRLYAVLLAALLCGGLLDFVGLTHFNDFGLYTNSSAESIAVIPASFADRLTWQHFLVSSVMLQQIVLPPFGSNVPLWSLTNEFWYYILFPSLLCVMRGNATQRLIFLPIVGSILYLVTPSILILFGVWLSGVVAWGCNDRRLLPLVVTLPLFGASLLLMRFDMRLFPYFAEYGVGLACALLINSLAGCEQVWPGSQISKRLADFSYSTYLLHFPLLMFITSVVFSFTGQRTRWRLNSETWLCFAVITLLVVGLSYVFSLGTEAKTREIRSIMFRLCRARRSAIRAAEPLGAIPEEVTAGAVDA